LMTICCQLEESIRYGALTCKEPDVVNPAASSGLKVTSGVVPHAATHDSASASKLEMTVSAAREVEAAKVIAAQRAAQREKECVFLNIGINRRETSPDYFRALPEFEFFYGQAGGTKKVQEDRSGTKEIGPRTR
jgi:hypothetical protein